MTDDRHDVKWSGRVPKWKLRRLYESTCTGIWDEELIDQVGMMLYMRCRDILNIHRAKCERKVTCPRCDARGNLSLMDRPGGSDEPFGCSECGWSMTWAEYRRTFLRKQLNPGGAVNYFATFVEQFSIASTAREKMLAIDRVIHEFHYSMKQDPSRPTRSAAVNLIVGKLKEVVQFLDELSGMGLPESMRQTKEQWRTKYQSTYWPRFLKDRGDGSADG